MQARNTVYLSSNFFFSPHGVLHRCAFPMSSLCLPPHLEAKLQEQQYRVNETGPRCCCGCHWTHETHRLLSFHLFSQLLTVFSGCVKCLVIIILLLFGGLGLFWELQQQQLPLLKKQPGFKAMGNLIHSDPSNIFPTLHVAIHVLYQSRLLTLLSIQQRAMDTFMLTSGLRGKSGVVWLFTGK